MKCPKCGFTSFDYLDDCKKCGADVSDVRASLGVIAISPDELAAQTPSAIPAAMAAGGAALADDHDFGAAVGDDDLLGGATAEEEFEQSFETMVEHTSFEDKGETPDFGNVDFGEDTVAAADNSGAGSPEFDQSEVEPEEEFLDLDFGGIFEDDET